MTWKLVGSEGPALTTQIRTRCPGSTSMGRCWYWFANPLKTTASQSLSSIASREATSPGGAA
ncbi:MAG: hypothetical protein M5U14_12850 [Acidimicrobiia bacterium]|nr:hypothetical protein [Acidimicrobiia bacterium]